MKHKRLWIVASILALFSALSYYRYKQLQIANAPIIPTSAQRSFTVLARQKDGYVEYFVEMHSDAVYSFLSGLTLERAEAATLEQWRYKVFLTDNLDADDGGDGRYLPPNGNAHCIVEVYPDCLEIDGITYRSPDYVDFLEYFDVFYSTHVGDYTTWRVEE